MKYRNIIAPVGLPAACAEVQSVCNQASVYRCGLKPNHLILPLDAGEGRTTFLAYMTAMYQRHGVLPFASGLDDYLEITLDASSIQKLKQGFEGIDGGYMNNYENIIGLDISNVANHMDGPQLPEFLFQVERLCDSACAVFFVRLTPSRAEEKLLDKLCDRVDHIKRLPAQPYTSEDIRDIIIRNITDHDVALQEETTFRAKLLEVVKDFGVADVRDAIAAARSAIHFADFNNHFTPTIDLQGIEAMVERWQQNTERGALL